MDKENISSIEEIKNRLNNKVDELMYLEGYNDGKASGMLYCLKRLSVYLQNTVGLKENETDAIAADILIPEEAVKKPAGL